MRQNSEVNSSFTVCELSSPGRVSPFMATEHGRHPNTQFHVLSGTNGLSHFQHTGDAVIITIIMFITCQVLPTLGLSPCPLWDAVVYVHTDVVPPVGHGYQL